MTHRLDYLRAGLKDELTREEIATVYNHAFLLDSRLDAIQEELKKMDTPERYTAIFALIGSSRQKVEVIYQAVCNPLPKESET